MSDTTFTILFEIYLVASTTFLLLSLLNQRVRQAFSRFQRIFRPTWSERHFQILKIVLLVVFVPLTVFETIGFLNMFFGGWR